MLFLQTAIVVECPVEVLFTYFPFHHTEYLKDLYEGSDLMKLIIFIASSKTLSEVDLKKNRQYIVVKDV